MSRHAMDLEKAITHDQQKAKSLSILMTDVKPESDFKNDPMNNIKELLEKVEKGKSKFTKPGVTNNDTDENSNSSEDMPNPSCMTFKEFMKKSKQELGNKEVVDIPQDECPDCARSTVECYYHSRQKKPDDRDSVDYDDDSRTDTHVNEAKHKGKKKKHKKRQKHENSPQSKVSERNVTIDIKLEPIPLEVIEKYRITLNEIKQMDRFADYSPGQPSKVKCT